MLDRSQIRLCCTRYVAGRFSRPRARGQRDVCACKKGITFDPPTEAYLLPLYMTGTPLLVDRNADTPLLLEARGQRLYSDP